VTFSIRSGRTELMLSTADIRETDGTLVPP
jgi:hypothetical protein